MKIISLIFFLATIFLIAFIAPALASESDEYSAITDDGFMYSTYAYDMGYDISQWLGRILFWGSIIILFLFAIIIAVLRWAFRVNERTELLYEICEKLEKISTPKKIED